MFDAVLYVLLGSAVLALSVWGAVLSVKSLPPNGNKAPHLWGIVGVGVLAFVLTVIVGFRSYYGQKDAERNQATLTKSLSDTSGKLDKSNDLLQQSRYDEGYIMGQLNGLSIQVGQLGQNSSSNAAFLAAIHQIMNSVPQRASPPPQSTPAPQAAAPSTQQSQQSASPTPYAVLKQVHDQVQNLDRGWQASILRQMQMFLAPYKMGKPFPTELPDDLAKGFVQSDSELTDQYSDLEPQIQKARDGVIPLMNWTASQKRDDRTNFQQANARALTKVTFDEMKKTHPNDQQFADIDRYLDNLLNQAKPQ